MNDEQAFLDALKATPADDTTRLVYADWLDERGEAAKAEYLRLVVGLVPHYATATPDPPEVARVQALAEQLPREWRADAAARFAVVLYGYETGHKIHTIKVARELMGCSLREAKQFSEALPARMPMRTTLENAIGLRDRFRTVPTIRVEVHPDDLDELPRLGIYCVTAYLTPWHWFDDGEGVGVPDSAVEAFGAFLAAAMKMPSQQSAELARTHNNVDIANGIEPSRLPKRMAELEAFLPKPDTEREWDIVLHATYHPVPPPHAR
jgi:uncharacterized protein (TIGR02996 family)